MRFSIRTILAATGVVAALSCLFFVVPAGIAALVLAIIGFLIPAGLVSAVIYSHGYATAFAIGALVSFGLSYLCLLYFISLLILNGGLPVFFSDEFAEYISNFKFGAAFQIALLICSGLTAVGVRFLCVKAALAKPMARVTSTLPQTMHIDPRDKAELYAILQGRMKSEAQAQLPG